MSKKKPAASMPAETKEDNFVPCCGETTCLDCTINDSPEAEATDNPLADAASTASAEPMAYTEDLDDTIQLTDAEAVQILEAISVDPIGFYTVEEGDTYASIAKKLSPGEGKAHDLAKHLVSLNNNRPLLPGSIIRL